LKKVVAKASRSCACLSKLVSIKTVTKAGTSSSLIGARRVLQEGPWFGDNRVLAVYSCAWTPERRPFYGPISLSFTIDHLPDIELLGFSGRHSLLMAISAMAFPKEPRCL